MPSNNLISLTSVSNLRLEQFRTQHELAKNFYDDHEFCPIFHVEEISEHRERIQKRTSPYLSPNSSVSSSYYVTSKQQQHYYQQTHSKSNSTSTTNVIATRAIPIIDPSNMTPVTVPMHQQCSQKVNTSSPMAQWAAYKNTISPMSTSPSSVHSSLSSSSSHSSNISSSSSSSHSGSGSCSTNTAEYYQNYYFGNSNNCGNYQHQVIPPTVIRAIPIIDPTTKQVFRQQQHIHHHHQQQQTIPSWVL
ncbi:hypothetical protein INT46_003014 [Mucor plumbeus]|uniref:Uncharacterized protein n=1 Tax=Mucor plumbeus TaxID=97098 RepID=A0A8H7V3H4_9FUNG|nr:hypothetical protein INT46_003014 [Mucor plumbeus]